MGSPMSGLQATLHLLITVIPKGADRKRLQISPATLDVCRGVQYCTRNLRQQLDIARPAQRTAARYEGSCIAPTLDARVLRIFLRWRWKPIARKNAFEHTRQSDKEIRGASQGSIASAGLLSGLQVVDACDSASGCCSTFCTAVSCRSGG